MKISFLLLTLLLCIGCNNPKEKKLINSKNKILIVFDSIPDMKTYQSITGGVSQQRNLCAYINDDFEEWSFLHPEPDNTNYTVEIHTRRETVNLKIYFLGGTSHVFFPLKRDSIYHIGFKDTIPYVKNGLEHINNYLQTLYGVVYDEKISSVNKMDGSGPISFFRGKDRFPNREEMKKILPGVIQKTEEEIRWREHYLDSI
ncbi:MAG: hypothetical protein Q4G63_07395, partial [Bacteroidia bacterium]|nr:hypothetical protein [Bacteroidia bacterium]